MEERTLTPVPAEPQATPATPADTAAPEQDRWADLAPGALTQDPQALLAAWMAGRAMPRRTLVRRLIGGIALTALLAEFIGSLRVILDQEPVFPLAFVWPVVFYLLFMAVLKDFPLLFLLRRALRRLQDGTLYPDRLHLVTPDGEEDLPLTDLIMVQRFKGWTVLIWGSWKHPQIVPIPDDACFGKAPFLYARLQELVTDIPFFCSDKPPRRRRHLVAGLLVLYVFLFTEVALATGVMGIQSYTLDNPNSNASVDLVWKEEEHTFSSRDVGEFPYPSTGEFQAQWVGADCCAVTYRATDGSLRVQLLESAPGAAERLPDDPPEGAWTTFFHYDDPVTLRWDADLPGYRLQSPSGELLFRQWEDFDGMGLALCDDDGLPLWTLTARSFPWQDGAGNDITVQGLLLSPVSLSPSTTDALLLCPADSPLFAGEDQAENPAVPRFEDTIDVCVNEDGVFFTWDGGVGCSQVLDAQDCARCGITSETDLGPLVLRWDVASFLTVEDGQVWSYTSFDQGQSWQTDQLLMLGSDTLTDWCYGFAGTGQGYAALNGTDANGAPWVKVFQTLDHGASWERFPTPKAADGVVRPLNGLCFYNAGIAVATAPCDDGSPWPYVFATTDDGSTWVEPDVPFAASGQTGANRLTDLYFSDTGQWLVTFTQAPEGTRELVFETPDLTHAPWTLSALHDIS